MSLIATLVPRRRNVSILAEGARTKHVQSGENAVVDINLNSPPESSLFVSCAPGLTVGGEGEKKTWKGVKGPFYGSIRSTTTRARSDKLSTSLGRLCV